MGQSRCDRNDHLIFSKGHGLTRLYSVFRAVGVVSDEELMAGTELRSRWEGHPTPVISGGRGHRLELGPGLRTGSAIALATGTYLARGSRTRTWVLFGGQHEMAEGRSWEASTRPPIRAVEPHHDRDVND